MTGQLSKVEVSNESFAEQVRSERLDIIWKSTLIIVTFIFWVVLALNSTDNRLLSLENTIVPWGIVLVSCLLCQQLLRQNAIGTATWIYALGLEVTIGFLMYIGDTDAREVIPFLTLVTVYIVGLMLPSSAMFILLPLNAAMLLGVPWIEKGHIASPEAGIWLAIALSLITGIISAMASGELYAIAEWALENYRRERDGATQLYESRQQVERSLLRQQALTKEIESANVELVAARRQAEEAKHFRGQFLANMSHELRTPLNAVIGFSETMLNFPMMYNMVELPDDYRKDLEQIHNSGTHLLSIINDILDLSKIDAGRLEVNIGRVELEPILKGVMSTAVGLVGGKPIKLTRETPDNMPDVKGDPVRIRQVLLNLYSNAAKFTTEGMIKLRLTVDDGFVVISVQDSGEGIHPDDLTNVFEEFRQGSAGRKKARAGAGLGLAISRQLLELMGGRIWVESTLDVGSTFYFALPVYKEVAKPEPVTEPERPAVVESAQ